MNTEIVDALNLIADNLRSIGVILSWMWFTQILHLFFKDMSGTSALREIKNKLDQIVYAITRSKN